MYFAVIASEAKQSLVGNCVGRDCLSRARDALPRDVELAVPEVGESLAQ